MPARTRPWFLTALAGLGLHAWRCGHRASTFLYVFEAERNGNARIEAFRIEPADGALSRTWSGTSTEFVSIPRPAGDDADKAVFEPSGRFRYGWSGSNLVAYAVDPATSKLTPTGAGVALADWLPTSTQLLAVRVLD